MFPSRIKSERGAALMATIVVSLLLFGVLVWYLSQASLLTRIQTHEHATEYALNYAESGLALAEQSLQTPGVLASTGTVAGSLEVPNGRCAYSVVRSSPPADDSNGLNPFLPVVVDASATGYYYLDKGQSSDPSNARTAQMAVLRAKFCFWPIGLFPIASPGTLRINQGTTVLFGPVYARDLIFTKDSESPDTSGVIEGAFFGDRVTREEGLSDPSGGPQPIGTVPHFPALGGKIRGYYENLASDESRLKEGSSLDGRLEPPRDSRFPVYFCEGDLHLGRSMGIAPAGQIIVYVKGNLIVHRSMQGAVDSWAIFIVEKDIRLDPTDPSNHVQLRGTFVVNGALRWVGASPDPHTASLLLTGSLLTGRGFDPIVAGIQKKFIRWQVDEALLPLPRFTQLLETQIVTGKYRHLQR